MTQRRKLRGANPRSRGTGRSAGRLHSKRRSFRQEVVALHRAIFRRNQARINASVAGYTPTFRAYERAYSRRVTSYQRRAGFAELDRAMRASQVVYVGDYHTLRQAQRSFLRLLRRLPAHRSVTVALEFVQGRRQAAVDAYLAGKLSDAAFLDAIDHESHWVFGGWSGFKDIFDLARGRGYQVLAIDTVGSGPAGTSLSARDHYAGRRIARVMRERPDDLVMVLIGELHVAPQHLPQQVDEQLGNVARRLTVYQNCEKIYWSLERQGLEHRVELVRLSAQEYCLIDTPPIVCQQSFLNWLEIDDEAQHLEAPEDNFKDYARIIAAFFDLDIGNALDEVEVTSVVDLSFLARLQRRGDFSAADMRSLRKQILASESYYIPRANMVYLGELSVNHAAEEATHFVRHVCSAATEPVGLVDAFYARVLEEAVGFLGSKLINHKRKCAQPAYFQRQLRSRRASAQDKKLARLVLKHLRLQNGQRVRHMAEVYECDVATFNAITHVLGYQLGERLYYGLVGGRASKQRVRQLFFERFDDEGDALAVFLELAVITSGVKIPERL